MSHRHKLALQVCGQTQIFSLADVFQHYQNLEKLGDGVCGEVFKGYRTMIVDDGGSGDSWLSRSYVQVPSVFKIIPIEGKEKVNGEKQKTYEEIFPELIISRHLTTLSNPEATSFTEGFIKLYNGVIACGQYPQRLLDAWDAYYDEFDTDNDRPDFSSRQKYLVLEYELGGTDAICYRFQTAKQVLYLILNVAHALAVAEQSIEFEHRDLHSRNVLVEEIPASFLTYRINNQNYQVPSCGIGVKIIDFTFSRCVDNNQNPVFFDMNSDEEMFVGANDHQFDIYRMMRDYNRDDWSQFVPKTNIFWVHYLFDKFQKSGRYVEDNKASPVHLFFLQQIVYLKKQILNFDSCKEFINSDLCKFFVHLEVEPH